MQERKNAFVGIKGEGQSKVHFFLCICNTHFLYREPKLKAVYVDCIVTCLHGDGINRTPSIAFTNNPVLRDWPKMTKRRLAKRIEFNTAVRLSGMKNRVIYTDWIKRTTTWVRESPEMIKRFCKIYPDLDKKFWVFSDGGLG